MVNLGQFIKGINALVTNISPFLLEKIFDIMDENKIGMVDQEKFLRVLQAEAPS
jgi:Ca2+-binding EF-hand superfamily protein